MTPNEYQDLALLTESPVGSETARRYFLAGGAILAMNKRILTALDLANQHKRFIFYDEPGEPLQPRYKAEAGKLDDTAESEIRFMHGLLGLLSEMYELLEIALKQDVIDPVHLKEELGDLLWYIAIVAEVYEIEFEDIMVSNIRKLAKRNRDKGKFDLAGTLERDLDAERATLEGYTEDIGSAVVGNPFCDLPLRENQ